MLADCEQLLPMQSAKKKLESEDNAKAWQEPRRLSLNTAACFLVPYLLNQGGGASPP